MTTWLRRHPLAICLPVQILVYTWRLTLLSPWFDEADELLYLKTTLSNSIAIAAAGGHPPLYFALVFGWMRLPLGLNWTAQGRILSVLFVLAATIAFDRLWARCQPANMRWWLLGLWTLSPFLLLYGRMSRSYSLQLLAGTMASAWILRFSQKRSWKGGAALAAALAFAIYVHYVPGLALLAAANLILLRGRRFRDCATVDVAVGLTALPWLWKLMASLGAWGARTGGYALTGHTALEIPLKIAYWAMAFVMGEATPDGVLLLGLAIVLLAAALVWAGMRRAPDLAWIALPAAVVGFAGVSRWVSYPFIPARMIFMFPLFLVLLATGARVHRRLGNVVLGGMLALALSGGWCYFHGIAFRNKQYPMPVAEIADLIRDRSTPRNSLVLVDSGNSDLPAMAYALGSDWPVLGTAESGAWSRVARTATDPGIATIWFLRNTHDVTPQQWNRRFAAELASHRRETVRQYEPFSPLERFLMRRLGMRDPPLYFHELLAFER